MNLWGGVIVGGRAHSGEVGGRAVLFVPLDGLWELHELPWEAPDDECEDSYWEDDATTAETVLGCDIDGRINLHLHRRGCSPTAFSSRRRCL
jgi:hypothetical protein